MNKLVVTKDITLDNFHSWLLSFPPQDIVGSITENRIQQTGDFKKNHPFRNFLDAVGGIYIDFANAYANGTNRWVWKFIITMGEWYHMYPEAAYDSWGVPYLTAPTRENPIKAANALRALYHDNPGLTQNEVVEININLRGYFAKAPAEVYTQGDYRRDVQINAGDFVIVTDDNRPLSVIESSDYYFIRDNALNKEALPDNIDLKY